MYLSLDLPLVEVDVKVAGAVVHSGRHRVPHAHRQAARVGVVPRHRRERHESLPRRELRLELLRPRRRRPHVAVPAISVNLRQYSIVSDLIEDG